MLPEEILKIELQFFEAGAGHIGELKFGLFGGVGRLAALGDIPHAAARGLHHLIVSAAAFLDVEVAEPHGHVIGQLRYLKALQFPVAAVQGDESLSGHEAPWIPAMISAMRCSFFKMSAASCSGGRCAREMLEVVFGLNHATWLSACVVPKSDVATPRE
jgi:hypothetical protein